MVLACMVFVPFQHGFGAAVEVDQGVFQLAGKARDIHQRRSRILSRSVAHGWVSRARQLARATAMRT